MDVLREPSFAPAILDDLPATRDNLRFESYVTTLADIVTSQRTKTPLTVGIFGSWGAGKTTILQMIEAVIRSSHPVYTLLRFDAWKFDKQDTLWRALLLRVLDALEKAIDDSKEAEDQKEQDRKALSEVRDSLYRDVEREDVGNVRIDLSKLGAGLAEGAAQVVLSLVPGGKVLADLLEGLRSKKTESAVESFAAAVGRERIKVHIDQVQGLEQFQDRFKELIRRYVIGRGEGGGRMVVFVDDLDRCLPEKAIEVLEAIKLFLDVPGCVFILGLDHQIIARGIEAKYKDPSVVDGNLYIEKIIQLPFQIPPIEDTAMMSFVTSLAERWPNGDDKECPKVFAQGLQGNPRRIKRTINVFFLLWRLAESRKGEIEGLVLPVRLAKIVVLQQEVGDLYDLLKGAPSYLLKLEEYFATHREGTEEETEKEKIPLPETLGRFVKEPAVVKLFRLFPPGPSEVNFAGLEPGDLSVYFTLTRRTEAPALRAEPAGNFREPELVFIPAGTFVMGSTEKDKGASDSEKPHHGLELLDFSMGRYEVTNAEYQLFVQETSHPRPPGWTGGRFPEGKGAHPVVNVTWRDAIAYCKWLSQKTGKSFTLPSEAEWEKAARGMEGRIYPWGDTFVPNRLNSKNGGPGETTPVGQYSPGGDSPFGVVDMAGNVWEWTRSLSRDYEYVPTDGREDLEAPGPRVLRGGSYAVLPKNARCAARLPMAPENRGDRIGFRVALKPAAAKTEA